MVMCVCVYTFIHAETHRAPRNTTCSLSIYLSPQKVLRCIQKYPDTGSPAVACPPGSGNTLHQRPLEMTGWRVPSRLGVDDGSAGSIRPRPTVCQCFLHEDQHGRCVFSKPDCDRMLKNHEISNIVNFPTPHFYCVSPEQMTHFYSLFFECLGCWGLVIARVFVLKKKGAEEKKKKNKLLNYTYSLWRVTR